MLVPAAALGAQKDSARKKMPGRLFAAVGEGSGGAYA
jgi:hypothetical protein